MEIIYDRPNRLNVEKHIQNFKILNQPTRQNSPKFEIRFASQQKNLALPFRNPKYTPPTLSTWCHKNINSAHFAIACVVAIHVSVGASSRDVHEPFVEVRVLHLEADHCRHGLTPILVDHDGGTGCHHRIRHVLLFCKATKMFTHASPTTSIAVTCDFTDLVKLNYTSVLSIQYALLGDLSAPWILC